jgi:hypothetical protein
MRRSPAIAAEVLKWRDFYRLSLFRVNLKREILVTPVVAKRKDVKPPLVLRKVLVDEVKARAKSRDNNE